MTMIRSGRATLHSDFIDINKVKVNQLKEEQEKKKGSLSSKMFGNSIRSSVQATKPPTSPQAKLREIKQASKEKQHYEKYIQQRTQLGERMQATRGVSMFQGLQCVESQALARANISEDTITKKRYESDSDELEIEGITNIKVGGQSKPPSILKSLLSVNNAAVKKPSTAAVKK